MLLYFTSGKTELMASPSDVQRVGVRYPLIHTEPCTEGYRGLSSVLAE